MADVYRAVSKVVFGPRPTWAIVRSGSPIYRAVSKVVSRPRPMWTTMRSGQSHLRATVWVQITLPSVGELKHYKSTILTTMVSDLEKQSTLNCINNSGIWGPTRHLPLKNNEFFSYFKMEETTKNLNQFGRPRDLNPRHRECESLALPRSLLAR